MEVTIELTPLSHDEQENHRFIRLNQDKMEISIGRASKNAQKGLLAAPDNAWFEYPILSRTHAKFATCPAQKKIYLQDCGSTHGTYLDKKRLAPNFEYTVADGQIITFGQRVTSGAIIYPAKEFRVNATWRSRVQAPTPIKPSNTTKVLGFHVPEDPHGSSKDCSRENSVQIIDSHPRTYSVPSTESEYGSDFDEDEYEDDEDDDDLEIASSIPDRDEKCSAITTPDHQAMTKNLSDENKSSNNNQTGPRSLNLKGPSLSELLSEPQILGTSQQNPVDLLEAPVRKHDVPDTESEDDGPEVLPISQPLKKQGTPGRNEDWRVSAMDWPVEKAGVEPYLDQPRQTLSQTAASHVTNREASRQPSPELPVTSVAGLTDGFESSDDDGFDQDDEFSDFDQNVYGGFSASQNIVYPSVAKPQVTLPSLQSEVLPPYQPPSIHDSLKRSEVLMGQSLGIGEAIRVSQPTFNEFSTWPQRTPSPSDAALVRKSSDQGVTANTSFSFFPTSFESCESMAYPDLKIPESHSKPYDQGPFSGARWPLIPSASEVQKDAAGSCCSHPLNAMKNARSSEEQAYCLQKSTGNHSSKINISNLVNACYPENPRSLKRKAHDMSSDNEDTHFPPAASTAALDTAQDPPSTTQRKAISVPYPPDPTPLPLYPSYPISQQMNSDDLETQLPDAQAREPFSPVQIASISQESHVKPVSSSLSTTAVERVESEGLARKKVKRSVSSTSGVGKFVSGVCVGLLGAVAAFIATIPASVYEEALREASNAV